MTLHSAIEQLLSQVGGPMSTAEIADALNKNGWYQKQDGSLITSYQIHGRTKNYAAIFDRDGTIVSLRSKSDSNKTIVVIPERKITDAETLLMDGQNCKSASIIDNMVEKRVCGLYCIRVTSANVLPKPFNDILKQRSHNILYIGIATGCLNTRFLNQELRGIGHGSFFRSLGAILGYLPPKGSLTNKSNKRNYKFDSQSSKEIVQWINKNIIVNWVAFTGDLDSVETRLINKYHPLLNLSKNPCALQILSDLRSQCVRIANE